MSSCQAAESACCRRSLLTGTEQTALARSIAPNHMPGDALICSGDKNHIRKSNYNWIRHLVKFMETHGHSPRAICLLHGPHRQVRGAEVGAAALASLKPLIVVLTPAGPPGLRHWLRFTLWAVPVASAWLSLTR